MDFYAKDPDAFMSNDPNVHALVIPETGKYFWEKPTTKEYPEIDAPEKFRIEVSVADQRVYIFRDDKKVCTLICSTGATDSPTVTGDFELFAKWGDTFYTECFGGGNYWITFGAVGYSGRHAARCNVGRAPCLFHAGGGLYDSARHRQPDASANRS